MAEDDQTLPEGTDTVLVGASAEDDDGGDDGTALGFTGGTDGGADEPEVDNDSAQQQTGTGGSNDGNQGGGGQAAGLREQATARVGDLKGQAVDKARDFVTQGKDRATEALDNVARMVNDAAATVDEKVGEQYGAYARRAAEMVTGAADAIRAKDVDDLFDDAKNLVRKSPAIAIGAAAAIGFVVTRIARAGIAPEGGAATGGGEKDVAFTPDAGAFGEGKGTARS